MIPGVILVLFITFALPSGSTESLAVVPPGNPLDGELETASSNPTSSSINTALPVSTSTSLPPTWTPFPAYTNTPWPPTLTPTPDPTRYPLPVFSTDRLIRVASPTTYIPDTCQFLQKRWDPENSLPGTVVVPLMFHSVLPPGSGISNPNQVTLTTFQAGLDHAHALGFETITTRQLAEFLLENAQIPERSMLIIVDDLYSQELQRDILPSVARYAWSITSGFISGSVSDAEWLRTETLVDSAIIDAQAHGFFHRWDSYIYPTTPEVLVRQEITYPFPVFQRHFGYRPTAFIWPGGDYTPEAVELAHQAGYQLGFTIRNRGPVMFNWVPQGDDERKTDYPLLVLPRVWSRDMIEGLDKAVQISQEAKVYAQANRPQELAWLETYCP
jgi:peptidoglycan/xylan/chitin deacetylase (PgdA/CDA1 family)